MENAKGQAFAAYNPGLSRLEIYVKTGDDERLIGGFPFGTKKQQIEDFFNTLIDDHLIEVQNVREIMEDERYELEFS